VNEHCIFEQNDEEDKFSELLRDRDDTGRKAEQYRMMSEIVLDNKDAKNINSDNVGRGTQAPSKFSLT